MTIIIRLKDVHIDTLQHKVLLRKQSLTFGKWFGNKILKSL